MRDPADVEALTRYMLDEIYGVLGLPAWKSLRSILDPVFRLPVERFSRVTARFDQDVAQYGLREAARRIMPNFASDFKQRGAERIPTEGPLLIASNHPGACDSLVVTASIPRPDLKIIATGIPFTRGLPSVAEHIIYVPREGPGRANVIRQAIRHLRENGALLIFPSGRIDPDPALAPDPESSFERWSTSLEVILRHAPQAQVLLSMVSGVLSTNWVRHPLTYLSREAWKKRRTAEFMQVIYQMLHPNSVELHPQVSFSQPLLLEQLVQDGESVMEGILEQARLLLNEHVSEWRRVHRA